MNSLIKHFAKFVSSNSIAYAFLKNSVIKFSLLTEKYYRENLRTKLIMTFIENQFSDLIVKNGPFKGIKYPNPQSVGSDLVPKLLGSYEKELQGIIIERLSNSDYSDILDIGCAEGYYAVGMLMKYPDATTHAFDIETKAQEMCQEMAECNKVAERIKIGAELSAENLAEWSFRGKALIICDCEGCEINLFDMNNRPNLIKHDLIIEVHDGISPNVTRYLKDLFKYTHKIKTIEPISDHKKAITYEYEELKPFTFEERKMLLAENRLNCTGWLFLQSHNN